MSKGDWLAVFVSASLSLLLPIAIIAIRHTVKRQRQGVIKDLEATFRMDRTTEPREGIVPSFEFVKFKYFLAGDRAGPIRNKDLPLWSFAVASLPLVVALFSFGIVASGTLLTKTLSDGWGVKLLPSLYQQAAIGTRSTEIAIWLSVMIVAYLASFLFVVRTLLRAVENFDLAPTTLLSSAVHVLFGAVTAVVIASAASAVFPGIEQTKALPTVLLVAAFAIGYVPDLGLRTLLRTSHLTFFKREDEQVLRALAASPLEIVDGIDSEVRSRLLDHHIVTVQNLATANPIMLFVETPYGVYQIIDWVAQAQLCSAVGPKVLVELWKLDIRTVFDLERAVLDDTVSTPQLRRAVAEVLASGSEAARKHLGLEPDKPVEAASDAAIKGWVALIVDDLPVQRLRQIWNRISDRLGEENFRLRAFASRVSSPSPGLQASASPERRAA